MFPLPKLLNVANVATKLDTASRVAKALQKPQVKQVAKPPVKPRTPAPQKAQPAQGTTTRILGMELTQKQMVTGGTILGSLALAWAGYEIGKRI